MPADCLLLIQPDNLLPGDVLLYRPRVPNLVQKAISSATDSQYTHAAIWAAMAFAQRGDSRAWELFAMINPVNHTNSAEAIATYKVEPYVMAADVYALAPHTGRGGWTWYTGSAGWMYRLAVEGILGLRLLGDHFRIDPVIPRAWPGFTLEYRRGETRYSLSVENPAGSGHGVQRVELDGVLLAGAEVPLVDDGAPHQVRIVLGGPADGQVQAVDRAAADQGSRIDEGAQSSGT